MEEPVSFLQSSHMNLLSRWICLIILLLQAPATRAEEVIRVGGTGSVLGVMKLLGAAYEKGHPGQRVRIYPSLGTTGGIMALSQGALELALSARPLPPDAVPPGLVPTQFGRTPFVFITHRDVTKADLSTRELEEVLRGTRESWPDGRPIRLVLRPEADTATMVVQDISLGSKLALSAARSRPSTILAITDQECLSTVASLSGSLGTATLTQIQTEKLPVHLMSFNGSVPGTKSLADGSYPLSIPLFLVAGPASSQASREFVRFVLSAQGRRILSQNGTVVPGASHVK
jgi:phosphate transport system substrate-binding protein